MYVGANFHMDAGVTDDSNCVLTTNSQGNDSIYFTRLAPSGERLVWRSLIYAGDPWVGRTSLAQDPRGWLHMTSEDGMERLLYCRSTDRGASWSCDTLATVRVMSHVRCVATPDTCLHIVYRTWTGGVQLRYMKLRPDGSVAVGPSVFTDGAERWEPTVCADTGGNLRVVYVDTSQDAHNLYYTVLRGDLETGGAPVPDSVLTLVPDTVIQTDPVRLAGPKVCVDSHNRSHVIFEQGVYGSGGDKYVYYTGEESGQPVEEAAGPAGRVSSIVVRPNPARGRARVEFSLESERTVRLALFDAAGRLARRVLPGRLPAGRQSVRLDCAGLAAGVYVIALDAGERHERVRLVLGEQ